MESAIAREKAIKEWSPDESGWNVKGGQKTYQRGGAKLYH